MTPSAAASRENALLPRNGRVVVTDVEAAGDNSDGESESGGAMPMLEAESSDSEQDDEPEFLALPKPKSKKPKKKERDKSTNQDFQVFSGGVVISDADKSRMAGLSTVPPSNSGGFGSGTPVAPVAGDALQLAAPLATVGSLTGS